jgi:hypothetical protein
MRTLELCILHLSILVSLTTAPGKSEKRCGKFVTIGTAVRIRLNVELHRDVYRKPVDEITRFYFVIVCLLIRNVSPFVVSPVLLSVAPNGRLNIGSGTCTNSRRRLCSVCKPVYIVTYSHDNWLRSERGSSGIFPFGTVQICLAVRLHSYVMHTDDSFPGR